MLIVIPFTSLPIDYVFFDQGLANPRLNASLGNKKAALADTSCPQIKAAK